MTLSDMRRALGLWSIVIVFGAAMIAIVPVDHAWTLELTRLRVPALVDVMRRTIFEGGGLGGSDVSILLFLSIIVLYVRANGARAPGLLLAGRPQLGYLLVSALAAGLAAVHLFKWVVGRPRPWSVLGRERFPYADWYEIGSHYITQGIYRGSFPSGHTAAVFILMSLVYVYGGDPAAPRGRRLLAWPLGGLVLAYTATMGIASAMARSHWLSDAIAAAGMVWILLHVLYYTALRVPEQAAYWRRHGRHPALPRYWEARFCGWGFIALMGAWCVAMGLRAFWEQWPPFLAGLVPVGVLLLWWAYPKARRVITRVHGELSA